MPLELSRIRDPDVREAVGQEEGAVDAVAGEVQRHLLAAAQPTPGEVGRPASVDRAEPLHRVAAGFGARRGRLDDEVDLLVVHDDREAVLGMQACQRILDGLAPEVDLGPAHRSGSVEHEGEVHRLPLGPWGGRRDHLDEDEALAAMGRPDEAAIGSGVDGHGRSSFRTSCAIEMRRSTRRLSSRLSGRRM